MKIDPYIFKRLYRFKVESFFETQRIVGDEIVAHQNYLLFIDDTVDYSDIAGHSPAGDLQTEYSGRKWRFSTYIRENTSQTASCTDMVTINHQYRKSHIVDLL